ncbi:MAG: NAD(P)/FAD-dependent oxidoreductase [Treponema sp.]|jgi:NADPH-dependent 2,4-dienoyl-CoA reductase/sulfur reductase-like enzyme|nr:NAD(P)/FAD-dependent oxidoreductase [Treponema sp.]
MRYELIIAGGGPAGLGAALGAYREGLRKILIVERDKELGGILNQCIHNGFGLHYFKKELTGPEYAACFIGQLRGTTIEYKTDTMVLDVGADRRVHMVSKAEGYRILEAESVILAMGCRERTRGAIAIPGSRPAGIFTAGTAQRYINMEGFMVGKKAVILGSGDIGLIMARRMVLEGAEVSACVEILPYSGGLNRNIVQCLHDYNIPLYLSHTITEIKGRRRVEQVVVSQVDENRIPVQGTEMSFDCDTILLSVGLIPENELSRRAGIRIDPRTGGAVVYDTMETSVPGIFACGNVVHVHDLVDFVSAEGERAGTAAAGYVKRSLPRESAGLAVLSGAGVSYTVPQVIQSGGTEPELTISFRVKKIFQKSVIRVWSEEKPIAAFHRLYMAPGEMERISLKRELLGGLQKELCITAEEEER